MPLRYLLMADATLLFLLGAFLVFLPNQVERFFHFPELPSSVGYLIALWGCALGTMGIGYAVAATDPIRHLVWVKVAIARSILEFLLGGFYLAKGTVSLQQAGFGIVIAGVMAAAYIVLYPRSKEAA